MRLPKLPPTTSWPSLITVKKGRRRSLAANWRFRRRRHRLRRRRLFNRHLASIDPKERKIVSVLIVGLSHGARSVLSYTRCMMQSFLAFRDSPSTPLRRLPRRKRRHLENARYQRRITHRAFRAQLREYKSTHPFPRPECIKLVLIILSTTGRRQSQSRCERSWNVW